MGAPKFQIRDRVRCIGDSMEHGVPSKVHGKRGVIVPNEPDADGSADVVLVDFGKHLGGTWYVHVRDIEHVTDDSGVNAADARAKAERRERIATACLAGLLADPNTGSFGAAAAAAVGYADALIEALDAPGEDGAS